MKILMIGAGREVRGGVSSVVNGYYRAGIESYVDLEYLPTMEDGSKPKKLMVAMRAALLFESAIKRADILHVHMSADASFHRKAWFIKRAKRAGKKIVIHMHGSTFDSFYLERLSDRGRRKVRAVFAMADAVIALSDYWRDFLSANVCDIDKIHLLYNSVPLEEFREPDYSNDNLLFMGIIGKRKGAYDLLDAFTEVLTDFPRARLVMAGDGEIDRMEALVRDRGLGANVKLPGWVRGATKDKYIEKCSVYVLPSYNEGMPMSVLEAMGAGLCTIGTDVGGVTHIIEDGVSGRVVKAGDVPGLTAAIKEVLGDTDLKRRLGISGRRVIEERFDQAVNLKKLIDIYEQLQ